MGGGLSRCLWPLRNDDTRDDLPNKISFSSPCLCSYLRLDESLSGRIPRDVKLEEESVVTVLEYSDLVRISQYDML